MKKVIFFFLSVLLLTGLSAVILLYPGSKEVGVTFDVATGASAHAVASGLVEAGILRTRYPFLVWTKLRQAGAKMKRGRYQFQHYRSAFWIVDDMVNGRTLKVRVSIPEGFSSWQIAERLDKDGICKGEEFLRHVNQNQLEGYLFPATYNLDLTMDPKSVADIMKAEFEKRWAPEFEARTNELGWTKKEAVIMASIIEKEVRVREELPLVSALYHNRLKNKMPLQADPTIQFAKGEWGTRLLYADYQKTKSPYNTYLHRGLPPGPICSPGMEALRAALWPGDSDVLYMVAKPDGHHEFSKTYRDHTNKVNSRNRSRQSKKGKK